MSEQAQAKQTGRPLDILMWVGGRYYTIESFIEEARRLGCCRRVPNIPKECVLGVSRVFLVHDISERDASDQLKIRKVKRRGEKFTRTFRVRGKRPTPRVFGYFTISGITFVSDGKMDISEELKKAGVKVYDYDNTGFAEQRGCGFVKVGGTYIVDEVQLGRLENLKIKDIRGGFIPINPPIYVPGLKRFRGWKYVYGDNILNRQPISTWFPEKTISDRGKSNNKTLDDFVR